MVPLRRPGRISPANVEERVLFEIEAKIIPSQIRAHRQLVPIAPVLIELGVDVEKVIGRNIRAVGPDEREQGVHISPSTGYHPGPARRWAFQSQSSGDQAHAAGALKPVPVSVAIANIQHRPEPPAVLRGVCALVQAHILDRVGIERGEKPKGVAGIVERNLIQQDQCLVGAAATDVEPRTDVRSRLYPRQQWKTAQNVRLTKGREILNLGRFQRDEPGLYALFFLRSIGLYDNFLALKRFRIQ